jgi:hypothetical protein
MTSKPASNIENVPGSDVSTALLTVTEKSAVPRVSDALPSKPPRIEKELKS